MHVGEPMVSARSRLAAKPPCPIRQPPRVALFVTCLVDLFRPSVGFAAVKLLEDAGCRVEVPRAQTCCGQPAYNQGDRADAVRPGAPDHRRPRGLRLRRGAVGLLRRHAPAALSGAVCRGLARWPSGRASSPDAPTSWSASWSTSWASTASTPSSRRGSPTTTPARACASSASSSSRAGCCKACAGSS